MGYKCQLLVNICAVAVLPDGETDGKFIGDI